MATNQTIPPKPQAGCWPVLWNFLGALVVLYIIGGVIYALMMDVPQVNSYKVDPDSVRFSTMSTFCCTGLPFLALFALLVSSSRRQLRERLLVWNQERQLDLTRQQIQLSTAVAMQAQQNSNRRDVGYGDPFADPDEPQMNRAAELIRQKRYSEARAILVQLNNDKARSWIDRIDGMPK